MHLGILQELNLNVVSWFRFAVSVGPLCMSYLVNKFYTADPDNTNEAQRTNLFRLYELGV